MTNVAALLEEKDIRPAELARKCNVNRSTVFYWLKEGVPAERVAQVEKETGIPREKLRPDIFRGPDQ